LSNQALGIVGITEGNASQTRISIGNK